MRLPQLDQGRLENETETVFFFSRLHCVGLIVKAAVGMRRTDGESCLEAAKPSPWVGLSARVQLGNSMQEDEMECRAEHRGGGGGWGVEGAPGLVTS